MAPLTARVEETLFTTFAPQIIKHIRAVSPRDADGLVGEVYAQMKREFQLVPPVTLHAPIPELLAGVWGMLRESIVAGSVSRGLREVVCEGVSAINQCSFCVDAHSILLVGAGDTSTANAIRAKRPDLIADRKTREVAMWAFANRQPGADILRKPPFTANEAPQLIASAACFHYIDRLVQVFLPDGPVALPSKLRWLRGTTIRVAGTAAGKRIMAVDVASGGAVGRLPEATPSSEFAWTAPRPALASAFGSLEAIVEDLGSDVLAQPVRELVCEHVAAWDGEEPGISRSWVEQAVTGLDARDQAAGRLALLVAIAPYQIDDGIIAAFRDIQPADAEILAAVAWASFTATRRISGWLSPAA
ncbi:carboxymuconolactone decarboxylase family protein [Mycobacterium sp. UM_CSW]|uniref:carboxymuconolactone decarboxylase family protein n=1 Tax=Mycobacterium sp. UM_CSW TaxID=1370119 RepID=UPI0003FB3FB2|nr:carboxymuconolactone decarboxylase family protein [Mycobacterium sp. UM_CSW]